MFRMKSRSGLVRLHCNIELASDNDVRPTPESGLLAEQVSTALARSAGGQRHFRPPGARHYAPTAMRAPAGPGQLDSRTVYDVCLLRTTQSGPQS